MNTIIKILVILLLLVLIGVGIKYITTEDKGFLEKTGEKIDSQINKIEKKFDKEGPAEKAGKKIDETAEKLTKEVEEMTKGEEK